MKILELNVHELTRKNEVLNDALTKVNDEPRKHARNDNVKHANRSRYRYEAYGNRYQRQHNKAKKMWTMWIPKGSKPPFGKVVGRPLDPRFTRANYTNIMDPIKVGDQIKI